MIVFRQVDARYPFLWETAAQPPGRWHARGEGPAHYFADTPDGAWAEFLRHEEITTLADLATVRRQMWAIDVGDARADHINVPLAIATGGVDSYPVCQAEARRLRASGARRLVAPSAALKSGGARGTIVRGGAHQAPPRNGMVIVVFGAPAALVGWVAAASA
ncbi:MAG: RES domain-containing protein, partial [Luteitalea sp.]|nr:RES domain-containing protein [Luteitalea sp.]